MIIPRFSIRSILTITAVCAVVFLVLSAGVRGTPWAAGVSVGLLTLVVAAAVYALLFGVVWLFAVVTRTTSAGFAAGDTPYRAARPPKVDTAGTPETIPATPPDPSGEVQHEPRTVRGNVETVMVDEPDAEDQNGEESKDAAR